ncbi:hypothetical protein UFOVP129_5 [uncultured Caudovirales phage]|uniref:Uncharacterized protein n=1 Tax=uncultured Caudovirales phage TaxID=2100421 RepID=A0A6J5LBG0_9CAUD|nr:hypothetical protein UFOVP129_5 [uncultured Caudovirales phage]
MEEIVFEIVKQIFKWAIIIVVAIIGISYLLYNIL